MESGSRKQLSNSKDASIAYYRLHTKRHMMSPPSDIMSFSMDWYSKYHMPIEFAAHFLDEQEFVDHMFIWLIYANFGVLLTVDNLLVTA